MDYDCHDHEDPIREIIGNRRRGSVPANARGRQEDLSRSEIDWVVEEAAAGILEGHPLIDRLLVSRRRSWTLMLHNPSTFTRATREIAGFIRQLRTRQYDIAIDLQGLLKSGIIIGAARAKRKIGFERTRELSYLFLNERLPAYDREKHALERYLDVARYLGAVDPSPACTLPIERERAVMMKRIDVLIKDGRRLVVINRWRAGRPSSGMRRNLPVWPTGWSPSGKPWWSLRGVLMTGRSQNGSGS